MPGSAYKLAALQRNKSMDLKNIGKKGTAMKKKKPTKKVGKKKVQDKFLKNKYPIDDILKALESHKQSDQWQNPQYIPNPETYLNQEKWNDILINNKDDEIVYIYHCKNCDKQKTTSEYRDLYVSCCDEQIQPTKEYR